MGGQSSQQGTGALLNLSDMKNLKAHNCTRSVDVVRIHKHKLKWRMNIRLQRLLFAFPFTKVETMLCTQLGKINNTFQENLIQAGQLLTSVNDVTIHNISHFNCPPWERCTLLI